MVGIDLPVRHPGGYRPPC